MRRVCVTGYGLIDAINNNPDSCWLGMINSYSYYRSNTLIDLEFDKYPMGLFPEPESENLPEGLSPRNLPRTMRYGMHAVDQAIKHSCVPESKNVGVFISSLTGGNELAYPMIKKDKFTPKAGINVTSDALCGMVSQFYGFEGINTCMYSACATGLVTVDFAMKYVDEYDYVIAGGADAGINNIDMRLFDSFRALGTDSRPFDVTRNGFQMAEAGAALILESEEKAKARGATIYAYLYPAGHASDAFDRTLPDGSGARKAMELATKSIDNIDVVNSHGTSTPGGDRVEYDAIQEIFPGVPVYSNKGKIGHTFAAAGVIETIYSIMSMNKGVYLHTHNCQETDMEHVITKPYKGDIKRTLNNSFGFGGKCISMVIENGN